MVASSRRRHRRCRRRGRDDRRRACTTTCSSRRRIETLVLDVLEAIFNEALRRRLALQQPQRLPVGSTSWDRRRGSRLVEPAGQVPPSSSSSSSSQRPPSSAAPLPPQPCAVQEQLHPDGQDDSQGPAQVQQQPHPQEAPPEPEAFHASPATPVLLSSRPPGWRPRSSGARAAAGPSGGTTGAGG